MDRLHVADLGGTDHAVDPQVAVGRAGRPHADRLVGQFKVRGPAVGLAENGDRLHAQLTAGADHTQGDFAPIGYQNPFEHRLPPEARASEERNRSRGGVRDMITTRGRLTPPDPP